MPQVTNISTYQFARLGDLQTLREELRRQCQQWALKGTILLSPEGINLFVAGAREKIDLLMASLRQTPGLEDLTPKYSESGHQPFTRMLVKIKKEIIAFGVEGIEPFRKTSPKLKPQELKRWLDEGKPVTLLDTRNDYEVKLGTFKNALPIGIQHFRDFPKAVEALPSEMKDTPIVMFCTGGIRCEKAGPFMEREGFKNIYQLDGGILKYFEECGSAHYDGSCFVFDQRVGVDPNLSESEDKQCFLCLEALTPEDQRDERYQPGVSCPFCFKTDEEKMRIQIEEREKALKHLISPLPGSQPYDNARPLKVTGKFDGSTLLDFIATILPHIPREHWTAEFEKGRFVDSNHQRVEPSRIIRGGERYLHLFPQTQEPDVNADIKILHEDTAILVIDKPAPLPVHASGRFNRNTLQYLLNEVYKPSIPRHAHRLDANTSGVMVYARSKHYAGLLQPQFTRGEVKKVYLAKVQGHPKEDEFSCDLAIGEEIKALGTRDIDENGRSAFTSFKVIQRNSDGTTLLEARPLTGRTNQIRIHLWKLGFPIVGEQTYLAGQKLGTTQTHDPVSAPLCLHSYSLSFVHPLQKTPIEFKSSPAWASNS